MQENLSMNTFPTTSALSKPSGRDRLPAGVLEYLQTRNRMRAFTVVQREFERCGITQTDLAERMGKGPDRICRLLGAPGNWTLDTVSDLLFAMSGAALTYGVDYPLDKPPRNLHEPDWLESTALPTSSGVFSVNPLLTVTASEKTPISVGTATKDFLNYRLP
jgi:hypothetical protein